MSERFEKSFTQSISPRWIVLKRSNGHFEPLAGGIVEAFDDLGLAVEKRDAMTKQFQGSTFAVFQMMNQTTFKPIEVVEVVEDEKEEGGGL